MSSIGCTALLQNQDGQNKLGGKRSYKGSSNNYIIQRYIHKIISTAVSVLP